MIHQPCDQLFVCRREAQIAQLIATSPAHLLAEQRTRRSTQLARDEMQLYRSLGIPVRDREDLAADQGVHSQFFGELAPQTVVQGLCVLAFAAGKFPIAFEVHTALTPCHEVRLVALDHRSRHYEARLGCMLVHASPSGLNGYAAHADLIGHTRHFGFRATQTVAPKSINA